MELRSKCERDTSSRQSNSSSATADSLSNAAFSPINLLGNTNSVQLDEHRLNASSNHQPHHRPNQPNVAQPKQCSNNLPKNSVHAAVASLLNSQQNADQTKLDFLSPFYSQWRNSVLNSANNSTNTLNGDNQFNAEALRAPSLRDGFSFTGSLSSLGNLSGLHNLTSSNNPLSNLGSNQSNNQNNNNQLNATFSSYGLELANDLNSAINCNSLLGSGGGSGQQTSSTSTNSTLTYNQIIERIYPLQQSIYNLINSNNASAPFSSSVNKGHFANNLQLYTNSLNSNLNSKFGLKNEFKSELNNNQKAAFKQADCNQDATKSSSPLDESASLLSASIISS